MADEMGLSIIVPSFNNPLGLKKTLQSIDKSLKNFQKKHNYSLSVELIVADNSTTKEVSNLIKKLTLEYLHYLRIKPLGLNYARDKAIKFAKEEYIILVDSDTMVKKDYVERIFFSILKNKGVDVIQGAYFVPSDERWFSLSESKWDRIRFYQQKQADGKNLILKKEAYFKIGGYDTDHFYAPGAESLMLMDKFKKFNLEVLFDDSIIVYHKYPSFFGEMKRYNKFGRASFHIKYKRPDLFRKEFSPWSLWKNLFTFRFGRINFLEYYYQTLKLTSYTFGYFSGKKHYLKELEEGKIISPHIRN